MKRWIILVIFLALLPAYSRAGVFIDALGRRVAVPADPKRIISLAPSITENLFALGLGDRIVGVTVYCNYPPEARKKERIGGGINPNMEKIVSLRPDLIIGVTSIGNSKTVETLTRLKLPVYITEPRGFEGVLNSLRVLGSLTNRESEAQAIIAQMKVRGERVARLTEGARRPKVLFVVWQEPLWTVGRESFITDLIEMAGGRSISSDIAKEATIMSLEEVVERGPEVIVIADRRGDGRQSIGRRWEGWNSIPAIRDKKIFVIDPSRVDRPSYRVIEAVEELARIFHPGLFPR